MTNTQSHTDSPVLHAPYWICLDPILDVERLIGMHDQFCYATANADFMLGYGGDAITKRLNQFLALPDDHPERVRCVGMNLRQIGLYLGLQHRLQTQAERFYIKGKKKNFKNKPIKSPDDRWEPNINTEKFRFFFDWLHDQKVFESYGRVIGLLNCPNQLDVPHMDAQPLKNPPEFIWFRTTDKPFYILPHPKATTKERSFVEGNVVWFNHSMYHAVQTVDYYAASFRVDGIFTEEFRRKVYELKS